ncbi:hypothetical protein [Tardiphaga sp.]|uniref:hypothetical protein n=1 Tax=Tardiphaga sp. TaxID=1926292 RepID=UPI00260D8040|nr:hypothetical protein [Tardiphaga sp.]MDB5618318.1 hypothetical protein [Tardiphaga sp.]
MSHDRSAAMFARVSSYGKYAAVFLKHLRGLWDAPVSYRREAHYMRGPGPKWREKQAGAKAARNGMADR